MGVWAMIDWIAPIKRIVALVALLLPDPVGPRPARA